MCWFWRAGTPRVQASHSICNRFHSEKHAGRAVPSVVCTHHRPDGHGRLLQGRWSCFVAMHAKSPAYHVSSFSQMPPHVQPKVVNLAKTWREASLFPAELPVLERDLAMASHVVPSYDSRMHAPPPPRHDAFHQPPPHHFPTATPFPDERPLKVALSLLAVP